MVETAEQQAEWAAAVRQRLAEQGRTTKWLGEEVARLTGRTEPYRPASILSKTGWFGTSLPHPAVVFAIEKALLQRPGSLSRLLGYVPAEDRPSVTVRDAIFDDPTLSDVARRALLAAYDQLSSRIDTLASHGLDGE